MSWTPSYGWVPIYGLFRSLGDRRRYSTTVFFRAAERAAVISACLHVVYVSVIAALIVILLWGR